MHNTAVNTHYVYTSVIKLTYDTDTVDVSYLQIYRIV